MSHHLSPSRPVVVVAATPYRFRSSASARGFGALVAVAITLGLLQSISAGFLAAPAAQMAKAAGARVLVASTR